MHSIALSLVLPLPSAQGQTQEIPAGYQLGCCSHGDSGLLHAMIQEGGEFVWGHNRCGFEVKTLRVKDTSATIPYVKPVPVLSPSNNPSNLKAVEPLPQSNDDSLWKWVIDRDDDELNGF